MDKINIEGVARLGEIGLSSVRAIVIGLHLNIGSCGQHPLPAAQQIGTANLDLLFHVRHKRRRVTVDPQTLPGIAVVEVSLKRQRVTLVQIPVRAEAGLAHPPVIERMAVRMKLGASNEGFSVDAVIKAFIVPGSIAKMGEALVEISATDGDESSMGIFGILGDDIDYSVDGICSPDGSPRASDDFDAFNILEQGVLDLPINAREQRRVNAPAVDKHQYRSGEGAAKAAHPQRPRIGVDPRDFNPRYEA